MLHLLDKYIPHTSSLIILKLHYMLTRVEKEVNKLCIVDARFLCQ
jgi:hypothetical protein